jgi:hypothetical protein
MFLGKSYQQQNAGLLVSIITGISSISIERSDAISVDTGGHVKSMDPSAPLHIYFF